LTEKLGGSIAIESQAGSGSAFTFYVRALRCPRINSPSATSADQAGWLLAKQPPSLATLPFALAADRKPYVLVCEDNIGKAALT